jgi:mono/diheme cytochrome c family protein
MPSGLITGLLIGGSATLVGVAVWVGATDSTQRADQAAPPPVAQGAAAEPRPVAPPPPAYDGLVTRGAQVYAANCFACHGGRGDGGGPWAPTLPVPARDFTDHGWMAGQSDGVLFTSIQRGVAGTPMPAFAGRLSEADTWAVVAYLRGFSPQVWLDSVPGAGPGPAAVGAGAALYAAQCAGCHGVTGAGTGLAATSLDPPPRDLANRGWLAAHTDAQLTDTLRSGVPGTAMPSFAGTLDAVQMQAVIDHLRVLAGGAYRPNPVSGGIAKDYLAYCASCHGANGDGRGIAAGRLAPGPRDFRDPGWMAGQTDERLADAIRAGRPGTAMPPFATLLSQEQIARLVTYLRGFAGDAGIPGADSAYRYDPAQLPAVAPPQTGDAGPQPPPGAPNPANPDKNEETPP